LQIKRHSEAAQRGRPLRLASTLFQAKKTPLGERGIRVIVVVANSVSVSAYGLWWIIIILVTDFLIIIVYSFSSWSVIFWLRCL
jgi:hypothetical protein